jgi:hypothetical protein
MRAKKYYIVTLRVLRKEDIHVVETETGSPFYFLQATNSRNLSESLHFRLFPLQGPNALGRKWILS